MQKEVFANASVTLRTIFNWPACGAAQLSEVSSIDTVLKAVTWGQRLPQCWGMWLAPPTHPLSGGSCSVGCRAGHPEGGSEGCSWKVRREVGEPWAPL